MQPGWSNERKSLRGYSSVIGSSSYAQELFDEEEKRRAQQAATLEYNNRIQSGEVNPDGTTKSPGSAHIDQARLELVRNAMKDDLSKDDIANKAGIAKSEVDPYLEAAGNKDYKKQNPLEAIGSFFKDVGEGIADATTNKIGDTLGNSFNNEETLQKGQNLADAYKRGEISAERFKEEYNDLTGNIIGWKYRADPDSETGFREVGAAEDITRFAGQVFEGGATLAAGPGSAVKAVAGQAAKKITEQTVRQTVGRSLAYGAKEAAFVTPFDVAGQALQGNYEGMDAGQVLKSIAGTYAANAALGAAGDWVGNAASSAFRGLQNRSTNTTSAAQKLIGAVPEEVASAPGFADRVNALAENSANVGEFKSGIKSILEETSIEAPGSARTSSSAQPELPERLALGSGTKELGEIDAELSALQKGEDASVMRTIADDGTDLTSTASYFDRRLNEVDTQIRQLETSRRDLEQQGSGIDEYTGDADLRKAEIEANDAPPSFFTEESEISDINRILKNEDTVAGGQKVADYYREAKGEDWNVKEMTPDEYLDQAAEAMGVDPSEFRKFPMGDAKKYADDMKNGDKFPMPYINKVRGSQEGRTRALAAKAAGQKTIKVAVADRYDPSTYKPRQDSKPSATTADPSEYTGDTELVSAGLKGIEKVDAQIAELTNTRNSIIDESSKAFERYGGTRTEVDPELAREKMRKLRSERDKAVKYISELEANNKTAAQIKQELDDLDRGVIPDRFVVTKDPVETVDEAVARAQKGDPTDSIGMQEGFIENSALRADAQEQMSQLMTPNRYKEEMAALDADYNAKIETIKQMPAPRQIGEIDALNADYMAKKQPLDDALANDGQRVAELQQTLDLADQVDKNAVDLWNSAEQSNPQAFGDVDTEALAAFRQGAERGLGYKSAPESANSGNVADGATSVAMATERATTAKSIAETLDSDISVSQTAQGVLLDGLTIGSGKINALDYMGRMPRTVLKRMGSAGEAMLNEFDKAQAAVNRFDSDMRTRYEKDKWNIVFKKKYMDETVDFLDTGKELVKRTGESERHFNNRVKASNSIKQWLQDTGRKMGLPEDVVTRNYLPHIIEKRTGMGVERIAEAIEMLRSGKDANGKDITPEQRTELARSLEPVDQQTRQFIAQKNLYTTKNGFLKKRTGADNWSRDLPEILSAYSRAASDEIYIKPTLANVEKYTKVLTEQQRAYVSDYVKALKGEDFSRLDAVLKDTNVPGTEINLADILGGARRLQNVALMGASIRTMAMQYGGATNVFRESTVESFFEAGLESSMAVFSRGSKLRTEFMSDGGMDNSFSRYLSSNKGVAGKFNKTEKLMFSGIAKVDQHMRMWGYQAGKMDYAKSIGKKLEDLTPEEMLKAREAGIARADKTQFRTSNIDIPLGQQTIGGKMVTQLQQFNLKQLDYDFKTMFGRDADSMFYKDSTGTHFSKQGATRFVKTVVAYGVLMSTMTSLAQGIFGDDFESVMNPLGFDPEDWLPFGEQVVGGYRWATGGGKIDDIPSISIPLASAIFGSERGVGAKDFADALVKYQSGDIDKEEFDAMMSKAPGWFVRNFVPGGTQGVRTTEGANVIAGGQSQNAKGQTRFMMENKDAWNIMRGLLGGQYATDEGREWLRNGMNTISTKHTIEMPNGSKVKVVDYLNNDNVSSEEKAQWIGYYQTKQMAEKELAKNKISRDDVTKSIRERLQAGIIAKQQAAEEARKYNNNVLNLYSPYLSGNQNVPYRLTQDLLYNVLIDTSKMRDTPSVMSKERATRLQSLYDADGFDYEY